MRPVSRRARFCRCVSPRSLPRRPNRRTARRGKSGLGRTFAPQVRMMRTRTLRSRSTALRAGRRPQPGHRFTYTLVRVFGASGNAAFRIVIVGHRPRTAPPQGRPAPDEYPPLAATMRQRRLACSFFFSVDHDLSPHSAGVLIGRGCLPVCASILESKRQ
jgi:hypothetical protein